MDQLELLPERPAGEDVTWLAELLDRHGGWLTATQIAVRSGGRLNDRVIRRLAADAADSLISGQRGYRHIRHATAAEIDHAANWLMSQAREMERRSIAIRRRAHQLVG